LKDLLGIRSSENSPNGKQQTVDSEDDFLNFFLKIYSEEEELQEFFKSNNCNVKMSNNHLRRKKDY